jgi:hypothetical protein
MMTPNPTPTMLVLFLGVSTFILIMLLPALLELKRPKDAGPRKIENFGIMQYHPTGVDIPLVNIEGEQYGLNRKIVRRIAEIMAILPNMET